MTHREAVIISAYTGVLLTKNFQDVAAFCEELLGRPILTHEYADKAVLEEIRAKSKGLILEIVKNEVAG